MAPWAISVGGAVETCHRKDYATLCPSKSGFLLDVLGPSDQNGQPD